MGGGNNNVIIRVPSNNEHSTILLNGDLNGNIDNTTSKQNVWNFISGRADYTILQDNSINQYINILWDFIYPDQIINTVSVPKTNINYEYTSIIGDANFRPIFEFKQ